MMDVQLIRIHNLITFGARYDTLHIRGSSLSNNQGRSGSSSGSSSSSDINKTNANSTSSSNSAKRSWRLSGVSSPPPPVKASRFNPLHYKEGVITGLSELIAVIWKKITRDPAILDFFTVVDVRKTVTISKPKMTPQMDVLTAMIGLMDHHALGTRAKEGLVLALALRDHRIESFLTLHTTFVYVLVAELSKHFLLAVDSLTYQATCGSPYKLPLVYPSIDNTHASPLVVSSHSQKTANKHSNNKTLHTSAKSSINSKQPPSSSSSSSSLSSPPMPKELTPLESFVRVLRFCEVIFTACARTEHSFTVGTTREHASASASVAFAGIDGNGGSGDGSAGTVQAEDGPGPGPVSDAGSRPRPPSSLQESLLTVYSEVFLEGLICSTLLVHNKYPMSVAADTVVRVLLSELFLVNRQVQGLPTPRRLTHHILTSQPIPIHTSNER